MRLLKCLACAREPFICPESYRDSHMAYHLRTAHKLDGVRLFQQSVVWSIRRGPQSIPVLKMIAVSELQLA